MIKLSASLMKKLPGDVEYSSRSYSAGIEVELQSGARPEELQGQLRRLYELLDAAVNEQMKGEYPSTPSTPKASRRSHKGSQRKATEAQLSAIAAIARDRGVADEGLAELMQEEFGVGSVTGLTIGQASELIDILKENGKARQ